MHNFPLLFLISGIRKRMTHLCTKDICILLCGGMKLLRLVWKSNMVERCVLSDEELIAYGTSAPSPVHSLFWDTLAGLLKTTFPRFPCNWLPLEVGLLTGAS